MLCTFVVAITSLTQSPNIFKLSRDTSPGRTYEQKPKLSMHSSIITLCSMKDRRRIVPRSRQLVNRRLRRCNGPTGRFEISASHETCDLHLQRTAQTWFQILTNKSEHFGNCPRRQTLEDPLKGILRERTKALWMAICGTSTIRLQTA